MSLNKTTFLFTLMSLVFAHTFAQTAIPKVVYVIDSITVINDPEKGDDVLSGDISDMSIIKNKDSLKLLGYEQFDVASFIFTRAYRSRPDSIKIIPSTKSMQRKDGIWIYRGVPYTGRIVNYYYSGRKQSEGFLLNGKVNGVDTLYYQNGHKSLEREYKEGRPNGVEREYYRDGLLLQEGRFVDGKEEGVWKTYYPNGQVKLSSNYKAGELFDSAVRYYSSGIVRERVFIQNGKVTPDPRLSRISQFMTKSEERNKEGDAKAAIEYASKAIKTDSTYADA